MLPTTAARPTLDDALAVLERGVDMLLSAEFGGSDDAMLLASLRGFEVQRRRLAAADARLVGEVDARGLAFERGARDTKSLLAVMLRVDAAEAKARVAAALDLSARTALNGEQLEPALPQVSAALAEGTIHPRQAAVIAATIDALPLDVQATRDREIEAQLVAEARRFAPLQLAKIAERLKYLYDQDGVLADDVDRSRRRDLSYRRHADGSMTGTFRLDPTTAEAFETVLAAQLSNQSGEQRGDRSPGQLRHDALRDVLLMMLRTGQLPASGGVTTTLVVTLTLQQWIVLQTLAGVTEDGGDTTADAPGESRRSTPDDERVAGGSRPRRRRRPGPPGEWLAVTNHGAFLTLDEVAPLVGDAQILSVAMCGLGPLRRVEAYGDKHRIFTENQRLALAARDRGCSFPGCTSTPAYCEAHHVIDYGEGGPTSTSNGTLLCPYHHRNFERLGYCCVMLDGVPHWIAPAWIDPSQTPVRNTAHDPAHP